MPEVSQTPPQAIIDPLLGKPRDAFPGEIVPLEEQKTLQRLMAKEIIEFKKFLDPAVQTGQLTPDEINAILKAGNIRAELKRAEYLKAIRTNPANIIIDICRKYGLEELSVKFNADIDLLRKDVEDIKAVAITKGTLPPATDTAVEFALDNRRRSRARDLSAFKIADGNRVRFGGGEGSVVDTQQSLVVNAGDINPTDSPTIIALLRDLGIPLLNNVQSIDDLFRIIKGANNQDASKAYIRQIFDIAVIPNLRSEKPGLEGVRVALAGRFRLNNMLEEDSIRFGIIFSPQVCARILDSQQ